MKPARRGYARSSPHAKIKDFCSSPRRADSLCSSNRCFFGLQSRRKNGFNYNACTFTIGFCPFTYTDTVCAFRSRVLRIIFLICRLAQKGMTYFVHFALIISHILTEVNYFFLTNPVFSYIIKLVKNSVLSGTSRAHPTISLKLLTKARNII